MNLSFFFRCGASAALFLSLLFVSFIARAQETDYIPDIGYAESLVLRATELKLHESPEWLILLHYKKGLFGLRSLVDDSKFFLSPEGKTSPEKELSATIRAFFKPPGNEKTLAGLKFIARFHWLSKKLNINASKLPLDFDQAFESYFKTLNIGKAILVFPAGYINSPASMYGHTLLVFENSQGNRLLSFAVNYAAKTEESFGPTFAFRGLFGLYDGYYSVLRYSDKINEYSSGEMRDMWEYTLNLNHDEIKQAFRHVIEMGEIGSRYFFADENCSYNLLFLIEAARSNLNLTSQFILTAEPIDTIRAVIKAGLVEKKEFRPSLYTQILTKAEQITRKESFAVIDFAKEGTEIETLKKAISPDNRGAAYDLTADYLKFLLSKDDIDLETYQKSFLTVLKARSAENSGKPIEYKIPVSPDQSHLSSKISIGGGAYEKEGFFQFIWRPTCHSLIDSSQGLSKNSEIIFLTPTFRYYPENKNIKLHSFDALKVVSLPPASRFFSPSAFFVNIGAAQSPAPMGSQTLAWLVDAAYGLTLTVFDFFHFFMMADIDFRFSSKYESSTLFSTGAKTGLIFEISNIFKTVTMAHFLINPFGEKTKTVRVSAEERISLGSRFQLVAGYAYEWIFKKSFQEFSGRLEFFF